MLDRVTTALYITVSVPDTSEVLVAAVVPCVTVLYTVVVVVTVEIGNEVP